MRGCQAGQRAEHRVERERVKTLCTKQVGVVLVCHREATGGRRWRLGERVQARAVVVVELNAGPGGRRRDPQGHRLGLPRPPFGLG